MEAIIDWEEEEVDDGVKTDTIVFPQLTSLKLWDLQPLKSFCPQGCTFQGSFLKEVQIRDCPALQSLPSAGQRVIDEQGSLEDYEEEDDDGGERITWMLYI
ncbi:uncharacterized protein LOC131322231 [Rhododendron vialii]|uniref:uncharacterized protein LOC131322231 n=1 Tax=Rhododendron vialii TaxID=182163 RepID=UPI00265F2027|nr:uncharacterized protein LOC131322231 [Rhododendron vialii]